MCKFDSDRCGEFAIDVLETNICFRWERNVIYWKEKQNYLTERQEISKDLIKSSLDGKSYLWTVFIEYKVGVFQTVHSYEWAKIDECEIFSCLL